MNDILTLTLNPALDISTATARVVDTHKLRCEAARVHPGGGGINVARVIHRLGSPVRAVVAAGGVTGQRVLELLRAEGVDVSHVPIVGDTRESFSVREESSGREFRFVLPGPTLLPGEWQDCVARLRATQTRWIVASGSLPPGAPDDAMAQIAMVARERGAALVVDTSGPALADALRAGVFMIKPSLRELGQLLGRELPAQDDWLAAARELIARGQVELVALSLGADGALLVSRDAAWRAHAVPVAVASAIGAGDSFVGGFVHALAGGAPAGSALRVAMAAGAGALLAPGTSLCRREDVERLADAVKIVAL